MALTTKLRVFASEPVLGHWCDDCLLSTAATWEIWLLEPDGLPRTKLGDMVYCPRCRNLHRADR